jgi:hypothetical protein
MSMSLLSFLLGLIVAGASQLLLVRVRSENPEALASLNCTSTFKSFRFTVRHAAGSANVASRVFVTSWWNSESPLWLGDLRVSA